MLAWLYTDIFTVSPRYRPVVSYNILEALSLMSHRKP